MGHSRQKCPPGQDMEEVTDFLKFAGSYSQESTP